MLLLYMFTIQIHTSHSLLCMSACDQYSCSSCHVTKLNNEERHTRPLTTALNTKVPKNPTSAGQAMRAGWGEGTKKKRRRKSTIVIISPTDYAAACQWSKTTREQWATQTELLCPPQTPAPVYKLTLATVYNPAHAIRQDIKVRETYLYFLESTEQKSNTLLWRPSSKCLVML